MDDAPTGQRTTTDDDAAADDRTNPGYGLPASANASAGAHRGATSDLQALLSGRVGTAQAREIAGQRRDLAAGARDRAADARDVQAQARDALSGRLRDIADHGRVSSGRDIVVRAAMDRERAFEDRVFAAEQRTRAALDREHAARDRLLSMRDRAASIAHDQLIHSEAQSGVLACGAGLVALQREVDRAHRADSPLTIVYIAPDVGSCAVDAVAASWCDVAGAVLGAVRSYDLVIAAGADALVCALCGAAIGSALARFTALEERLAAAGVAIAVGYAELAASDTPGTLIDGAAADAPSTRTDDDSTPAPILRDVSANADGQGSR